MMINYITKVSLSITIFPVNYQFFERQFVGIIFLARKSQC